MPWPRRGCGLIALCWWAGLLAHTKTVLTGRSHDRTGVFDHGFALRSQEKTLARALQRAGKANGHLGNGTLTACADRGC